MKEIIATVMILTNPVFVVVGLMLYATNRAGK